jgi:hypothetical protein
MPIGFIGIPTENNKVVKNGGIYPSPSGIYYYIVIYQKPFPTTPSR